MCNNILFYDIRQVSLTEGSENENDTDQHNFTEKIHKETFTNYCCGDQEFMFVNPLYTEESLQYLKNEKSFPSTTNESLNFSEKIPISQQEVLLNNTTTGVGEDKDMSEMDVADVNSTEDDTHNELYNYSCLNSLLCPTYATLEPYIPVVANREDEMKSTDHYQCLHHR